MTFEQYAITWLQEIVAGRDPRITLKDKKPEGFDEFAQNRLKRLKAK